MAKKQLVIQHDLSKLSPEQLNQYLRDVSEFIGLDPDLNGLDTIWMPNENGPGQSLVVYARRGTAEILRNNLDIEVDELTDKMVNGSIVFTAKGHNTNKDTGRRDRQEIATGSKYINGLTGKQLDDAIMTASTRALRRLTMQFTSLGILDESEVKATLGDTSNPAANAQPIGAPIVFPPPQVVPNNAPGKDVTPPKEMIGPSEDPKTQAQVATVIAIRELQKAGQCVAAPPVVEPFVGQQDQIDAAYKQLAEKKSAQTSAPEAPVAPATPAIAPVTEAATSAKPKRARKAKNSVSLEGPEPEVVSRPTEPSKEELAKAFGPSLSAPQMAVPQPMPPVAPLQANSAVPTQANSAVPAAAPNSGTSVPNQGTDFPGKPSEAQMAEYRKKVSEYTSQLPSSENMGSVQKMRAFITRMSGTAPQFMTVDQWQEQLGWFESFVAKNSMKGLIKYINDILGVK